MSFTRSLLVCVALLAALVLLALPGRNATTNRVDTASALASYDFPWPEVTMPPTTTTTEAPPPTTEVPRPAPVAPRQQGVASGDCANPVISEATARAESGCRWDAFNPTGCGGRSCIGFYQLDAGHFMTVSPWNSNVSGSCVDLAAVKWEPWAQTECASRLGPGAWG